MKNEEIEITVRECGNGLSFKLYKETLSTY